jgi:alanine racemase
MNLCSCESDEQLNIADNIQLISSQKKDSNTLYALAEASGTIVYECLVRLDAKIRREII